MIGLVAIAMAVQGVDAMRHQWRLVIASAPSSADPALATQRAAVERWPGAADRDVTLVTIAGDTVSGASDGAEALRRRYALPPDRFGVVLVGKDGHVARRAAVPFTAAMLQGLIDAMPMRRAGQR